jgi:nitrous oxidase accessory protein
VRIEAPGVVLEGLELRGSGDRYAAEDAGVRIERASDVALERLRIDDVLFGVFAAQADRCRMEDVTVVGKDLDDTRRGDGIRLWYSSHCVVRRARVERSRDVVVWYSQGTVFEDSEVRRSRYGLHYMYSDHNRFRGNRFEDNQVGAAIMYSHDVELVENTFSFSNGVSAYGLLVKDADDIFVERNRFVGNATALFFDGAPQSRGGRVVLHQNLVARNDVGLALQPLSRGLEIWENAFTGNLVQVQVQGAGSAEANVWAKHGRGNFWSDAMPYDRDRDGVSELPFRLESGYEGLADAHPVLTFFQGSAASEAVDLAARLFPVFVRRTKLVDPHPLVEPTGGWVAEPADEGGRFGLLGAATLLLGTSAALLVGARRLVA